MWSVVAFVLAMTGAALSVGWCVWTWFEDRRP